MQLVATQVGILDAGESRVWLEERQKVECSPAKTRPFPAGKDVTTGLLLEDGIGSPAAPQVRNHWSVHFAETSIVRMHRSGSARFLCRRQVPCS